jgi:mannose-6-phosphate isomerase-like protein (cupin superfamily)
VATHGVGSAHVVQRRDAPAGKPPQADVLTVHDAELVFSFLLEGSASLDCEGHGPQAVTAGDAFVVPAGKPHALRACSPDLQLLEVALPAAFATTPCDASRS